MLQGQTFRSEWKKRAFFLYFTVCLFPDFPSCTYLEILYVSFS